MMQVEHGQPLHGSDPELAVWRKGHVGSADAALCRGHAVGFAKPGVIERQLLAALVLFESGGGKPEDAVPSGEPQLSVRRSHHTEKIEIVVHLYQLISLYAVDPLWRG